MTYNRNILLMLVAVVTLCPSASYSGSVTERELQWAAKRFGLVPPFRIIEHVTYEDGGTVGGVISDGNNWTLSFCKIAGEYPAHLYVGGTHPTKEDARRLPLWSNDERALLFIVVHAIDDTLSEEDQRVARSAHSYMKVPDSVDPGMWHLVRGFGFRELQLRAHDIGEVESLERAARWCQLSPPVRVDKVDQTTKRGWICATVSDSRDSTFQICVRDSVRDSDQAFACWRRNNKERCHGADPWGFEERALLTVVSAGIDESFDKGVRRMLDEIDNPDNLPNGIEETLWRCVRVLERRKRDIFKHDLSSDI